MHSNLRRFPREFTKWRKDHWGVLAAPWLESIRSAADMCADHRSIPSATQGRSPRVNDSIEMSGESTDVSSADPTSVSRADTRGGLFIVHRGCVGMYYYPGVSRGFIICSLRCPGGVYYPVTGVSKGFTNPTLGLLELSLNHIAIIPSWLICCAQALALAK